MTDKEETEILTREEEFAKVKELIKKHFSIADERIYFTRNSVGDCMATMFSGQYFTLDICYKWSYYELFGCTESEQEEIEAYYEELENESYE